ncbi:MAG: multicopper oxidase domain-containing protein [Candidatus Gracilibacteria bacterium]|nr:multicopper oxidase domain-containing protein [Candidatus Gracilibacteria bacterium]
MNMGGMKMGRGGETFDESVENLPEAKKTEIIVLKDGDTYEMVASAVKQEVGNRFIKRLAYNGMIPGPLLKVEKGAKIKIKLTNKLGIETTLHSHGLRLDDYTQDGVPTDMGGTQKPMKPGDSFTYELNFPDTGVFWYHPHIREDYTQEMGLYGNFSVTEKDYWNKVDGEEFLILDDFSEDDIFYKDKVNKTLMGRFGNIMMINNDEDYKLEVDQYKTTRLFITNVANTRTFDFEIVDKKGKAQELKLVGGDIGRIEKEEMINSQIIAPAEKIYCGN